MNDRTRNLILAASLFAANVLLNAPLFMPGEMLFRGSIESGYISMVRFISSHPNPWGWDPQQYCGLPTRFLYLPGLPYTVAALLRLLPGAQPATVYRTLVGILTCLGPVTLFLFALRFMGSRWWAAGAALAYTVFSPGYGLLPHLLKDLGDVRLPWRILVLIKYGEGPHTVGLSLLPLALIALWTAAMRRKYWQLFVAAVLLAAIVLTNWIAAFSLAFCCLLLLVATFRMRLDFQTRYCVAAGLLGYLLACFWLTPSFIDTVVFNWPVDSFDYHVKVAQRLLIVGLAAGVIVIRLLFARSRNWYLCFVTLGCFVFGWIAVAFSVYGVDTIPESRRYAPEFELFLILAVAAWLRLGARSPNSTARFCAIASAALLLLVGAGQAWNHITLGWSKWKPTPKEATVEYRAAQWLAGQKLAGRVMVSGGLRYRLDSWFDVPQVGGGWESGLRNRAPVDLAFQVRSGIGSQPGQRLADALIQMKAMAVEYLVIHGAASREYYRDFVNPGEFASLPVVWHEEDDTIYAVPRASLAHLITRAELPKYTVPWAIAPLAAAIDDPARPRLQAVWRDQNTLRITGAIPPGALVYVHVSHHPGWHATEDGRPVGIEKDGIGFMAVDAAPAAQATIELHYRGTPGERAMAAISGAAWILALAALFRRPGRRMPAA